MRRYASPAAFRAAIDVRLRAHARRAGAPVMVVRRQAALERLIVRLMRVAPGRWALKGGLALDTRLGDRARSSLDMDVDHAQGAAAAREDLQRSIVEDLGDNFSFAITGAEELRERDVNLAIRYRIECSVAGTPFEPLQMDVTITPPHVWEVEEARRPGLLADMGLGPIEVLLVPLERQIAEKLHAYTRTYNGATTRAKDLVDFVLIRLLERVEARRLAREVRETFARRGTHPVPKQLPLPPTELEIAYRREAEDVGITTDVREAHRLAAGWLDPILQGIAHGRWEPERGTWIKEAPAEQQEPKD